MVFGSRRFSIVVVLDRIGGTYCRRGDDSATYTLHLGSDGAGQVTLVSSAVTASDSAITVARAFLQWVGLAITVVSAVAVVAASIA